jgi:peptidoglycan hydrolase-like protein with peptidoglycan-binding domain
VSVFYGAVPAWRDLAEGDEGVDVAQLETNLVALGYDPDGLVTIDEEYTSRTEDLVEQWQEDLGLDITGVFSTESVIVVDGPVSVTTAPSVGDPSQSGAVLGSVSARAVTTTIVATQPGQITALAPVGTAIEHGTILYVADGVEVRAITAIETVDGLADDGTVREYVLVPEGHQVTAQLVAPDESLTTTRPTLELSTQTLSVVVPVGLADQGDWIAGQTVQIELPDETVVGGEVIDVGTVAQDGGQGVDPTVEVIVEITELVADDLPASEVIVTVAGESILDAMVVPTRALVTLSEGGFAVEKVLDDATTVLVAVETGAFDDGVVEVTSSQLAPGDDVVVPQ